MKEERYDYFDDEELEALMEEVERSGMIAPPVYLKELIMEEAAHVEDALEERQGETHGGMAYVEDALKESREETHGEMMHVEDALERRREETHGEMVYVGNALGRRQEISSGKSGRKGSIREAAQRQFWIYSFKIAAAAAVAVISLIAVPMDFAGERMAEDNHIERQIEKDVERYQEAKRDAQKQEENGDSGLWGLMGSRFGDRIWNGLSDWFGMEE